LRILKAITTFFIALVLIAFSASIDTYAAAAKTAVKLPKRLAVESPKQKSSFENKDITIVGWALDPAGVKQINIYLNGKLQGKANYGLNRPDVNKVYPGYVQGAKSGYSYTLKYATLKTGSYKLSVEMVGKDNKKLTKEINFSFKKAAYPIKSTLESPTVNFTTEANSIKISGWAAGPSGIKEIKVYFDGTYKGSTIPTINRKDIEAYLPSYKNSLVSGFSYEISMLNVSQGTHKLLVEYIGNDGQTLKTERSFEYKGLAPRFALEAPKADFTTDAYNMKVIGWALNSTGINTVNIYVDNILQGQASANISREDITNVYPGYSLWNNGGYLYNLDMRNLTAGAHELKVEIIAGDGTVLSEVRKFTYNKPQPIVTIESPAVNQNISTGNLNVSGWALDVSGVKSVSVVMDGNFMGSAMYGDARFDLMSYADKYPEFTYVGYNYYLDISTLSIGEHSLEIVVLSNDGTITTKKTNFNMHGVVEYVNLSNDLDYYVSRQFNRGSNVIFGNAAPATYDQLKYYMDPKNFINDPAGKYMFLKLTYIEGIDVNDLNKILMGKGVLTDKGQAFLDAGRLYNVNPIYLIAHALLETGNGRSQLSNGVLVATVANNPVEPMLTYNMYGIGAKDANPLILGSEYAYKQQWFSVEAAIIGGAQFISGNYIQSELYKQYTLYKMKWNFDVLWHQYATDIGWAYKQTKFIKDLVDQMEKPVLIFEIPVFYELK
jgi:beta-N-acetylglucosaminidase